MRVRCDPDPNLSIEYLKSAEGVDIVLAYFKAYFLHSKGGLKKKCEVAKINLEFLETTGFTFDVVAMTLDNLIKTDRTFTVFLD